MVPWPCIARSWATGRVIARPRASGRRIMRVWWGRSTSLEQESRRRRSRRGASARRGRPAEPLDLRLGDLVRVTHQRVERRAPARDGGAVATRHGDAHQLEAQRPERCDDLERRAEHGVTARRAVPQLQRRARIAAGDRKSTRLNSSHGYISYAVFCLKKK